MRLVGFHRMMLQLLLFLCITIITGSARGGGSGLNTLIIVNDQNPDSLALGNYYRERREIPPANVLRISWTGGNVSWTVDEFRTCLLNPLTAALGQRQISNQIDIVVLSSGIPFQTVSGSTINSTTACLYYGFRLVGGPDWKGITNSYVFSESEFHRNRPISAIGPSFLAVMLAGYTPAQARTMIDQGVAGDGNFPSQPVVLATSSDPIRSLRHVRFDNARFEAQVRGLMNFNVIQSDAMNGSDWLGLQTGLANFSISKPLFVPGAIADSLTSFGGIIFGPNGQTSLLEFIKAGASGSYGTVTEPGADGTKFPDPMVYFFQSRGFSLAESYYQSIAVPYLGLIVGEPLSAPFAAPAEGSWIGASTNTALSGVVPMRLKFTAHRERPVQQVDLFLDGKFLRTLTNLPPQPGNRLSLTLHGTSVDYTVEPGATLDSIAAGLTAAINAPSISNKTGIVATRRGDRLSLRFVSTNTPPRPRAPFGLTPASGPAESPSESPALPAFHVGSLTGASASLTTFVHAGRQHFVSSPAVAARTFNFSGSVQPGAWIQLTVNRTSGAPVTVSVTNTASSMTMADFLNTLATRVNAATALQGPDGIRSGAITPGFSGAASMQFHARTVGPEGAGIRCTFATSGLNVTPASNAALDENLDDLWPRNHLYITAGATDLDFTFPLDTTTLPDGAHELTAVAYEGSNVRTQTRLSIPIRIANTSITASLISLDATDFAPVQGTCRFQVNTTGANITNITLHSTGGALASLKNQSSGTFTVDTTRLGAGLHPFHVEVSTSGNLRFRSAPLWIRFTP